MITAINSSQLGVHLELVPGQVTLFAIEGVNAFMEVVQSLISQAAGDEGTLHLYDDDLTERPLQKNALLVTDPLRLTLNDKTLLTPVLARVAKTLLEEMTLEWQDLQTRIYALVDDVIQKHDDIPLVCDVELVPALFLKTMGLALENGQSFYDRLTTYLDLNARFTKINLIIFVNLRAYLTDEQWEDLKHRLSHTSLSLLLVEQTALRPSQETPPIQQTIVDEDRCIIL